MPSSNIFQAAVLHHNLIESTVTYWTPVQPAMVLKVEADMPKPPADERSLLSTEGEVLMKETDASRTWG